MVLLRLGPVFPCVFGIEDFCVQGIVVRRREAPNHRQHLQLAVLVMKNARTINNMTNQQTFHIAHRHTSLTHDNKSMHHNFICLESRVFTSVLRALWCAPQMNEKMAAQGMGNKKINEMVFSRHRHRRLRHAAQRHSAKHVTNPHSTLHDTAPQTRTTQ